MTEKIFAGFNQPEQNWSKLPHEFFDMLHLIDTIAEMIDMTQGVLGTRMALLCRLQI